MKTKSVEWSYPTSPNAVRFGFKNGCWTVQICTGTGEPRSIAAFITKAEAIAHAQQIKLDWNPAYTRFHSHAV